MKTFFTAWLLGAVMVSGIRLSNRTNDPAGFYLALLVDAVILAWLFRKSIARGLKKAAGGIPNVSITVTVNPKPTDPSSCETR
jgi:hypothetical protein